LNKSQFIRIALIGILIFTIFKKSLVILSDLLFPIVISLTIENEIIIAGLYILSGVISFGIFMFLTNKYLAVDKFKSRTIYILIIITVVLIGLNGLVNYLTADYMIDMETGVNSTNMQIVSKYVWSKTWNGIFPISALIYLWWRQTK
jgi:hypothetical protein